MHLTVLSVGLWAKRSGFKTPTWLPSIRKKSGKFEFGQGQGTVREFGKLLM